LPRAAEGSLVHTSHGVKLNTEMLLALNPAATKKLCDDCVSAQNKAIDKAKEADEAAEAYATATEAALNATTKLNAQNAVVDGLESDESTAQAESNAAEQTLLAMTSKYNAVLKNVTAYATTAKIELNPSVAEIDESKQVLEDVLALIPPLEALLGPLTQQVTVVNAAAKKLAKVQSDLEAAKLEQKRLAKIAEEVTATMIKLESILTNAKKIAAVALATAESVCALLKLGADGFSPHPSPSPSPSPSPLRRRAFF